jgi:hypothetical protein
LYPGIQDTTGFGARRTTPLQPDESAA